MMDDSLFDDVTSLLDGDFGDDRILKQISRACKNNEVISNYERNYVQKLAEQYLGKKPKISSKTPEVSIPKVPDVVIPTIQPTMNTQMIEAPITKKSNLNLKNSKTILALGGIALIIMVSAVILFSNDNNSFLSNTSNDTPINTEITLSVNTDLSSYSQNDLISINGISSNASIVNLSIKNQNNVLVWAEQISVKSNGQYATLAIAGGSGWDISGNYTLNVDNGSEIKSITFLFNS
tara:strand:+ start:48 stop:755 length:708 start_codon:yes stop_codon:yes gene_type:complete